jgi:hypothetical protein
VADAEAPECPMPGCRTVLGRDPFGSGALRFDVALTVACGRVFPRLGDAQLLADEEARAEEARRRRDAEAPRRKPPPARAAEPRRRGGHAAHAGLTHAAAAAAAVAAQAAAAHAQYAQHAPAQPPAPSVETAAVVYELRPLEGTACPPGCAAPPLDKPFMRTPQGLTAASLSRYVASRLPPDAAAGRGVVICAGGFPVSGDCSLAQVLQATQQEAGSTVPAVRYRFEG